MSRKKSTLDFDHRGGRQTIQGVILMSEKWLKLSPQAKVLITLMQRHWDNYKEVAYGVREAQEKIPCAKSTAQKAFKQLEEAGFIKQMSEHVFYDKRSKRKARTWRLTWMPFESRAPTNDWEN
jgi:hypothetical protein